MKKFFKVISSLIIVFTLFLIVGCNGCKSKVHPVAITSWDLPKETYELGEYLDLTGSTIAVEYSDGSTENHEVNYEMVSVFDLLNVYGSTGKHSLQVTYAEGDYKVTFEKEITVSIPKYKSEAIAEVNAYKAGTESIYSAANTTRIEELKLIARSAIYAAEDSNEVDEIKAKTIASIDTVATSAEQQIADNAIAAIQTTLNEQIQAVQDNITALGDNFTQTVGTLMTKEAANALKTELTNSLNTEVAALQTQIANLGTGTAGADGKNAALRVANGEIQWSFEGEDNWTTLLTVASLKGEKGDKGDTGAQGPQGQAGTNGTNGTNGTDGADGADGRGISAISLTDDGKLKFEFDDASTAVEIDLSSVLTPAATLQAQVTALQTQVANELDGTVDGSLQNQIDKVVNDLATLKATVDGLDIQDTFDGLQDQIDQIVQYFTNSNVDLTDDTINATKVLESILAEKIESYSTEYLDRTYTLDEFKELLTDKIIPQAKAAYATAKLLKEIAKNCADVAGDDTLTTKQKVSGILDELRRYDEVLLEFGLDQELVTKISTNLHKLKDEVLELAKTEINKFVDKMADKLDLLYDFDELMNEMNNSTLESYRTEIQAFLTDINYTGAADFASAIDGIKDAVDELDYRNALEVLNNVITKAMDLMQIDSLNTLLPALLGAVVEEYYNSYVTKLAEYLPEDEAVALAKVKDKYLMAILRTNSAENAVNYANAAKDAIFDELFATTLGQKVKAVHDAEDTATAVAQLALLDAYVEGLVNDSSYGVTLKAEVTAKYYASYNAMNTVKLYELYLSQVTDPTSDVYGFNKAEVLDYVRPLADQATLNDIDTTAMEALIDADVHDAIEDKVKDAVDSLYKKLYDDVDYNIHAHLGL